MIIIITITINIIFIVIIVVIITPSSIATSRVTGRDQTKNRKWRVHCIVLSDEKPSKVSGIYL